MNLHAVNDLIESSLQRWYRAVSEWRRPLSGTATGCVTCRGSEFAVFDRRGRWPHDLLHALVEILEVDSMRLARELHEERHCSADDTGSSAEPCEPCIAEARATVIECARTHSQDIADVINECAMPRFAVYVEMNTNLALTAATRGEWAP